MTPEASPEIRILGPDDTSLFESLLDVFGDAFEQPETYGARRPDATYLRDLLARDYFIAIVAVNDGRVLGGLTAYELRKPEQERSEVYLYDLAVALPYRRRGIATALIGQLRNVAASRGAYVVFVQADRGDEPAIALYSQLGHAEDVLHFDIDVESHEPA